MDIPDQDRKISTAIPAALLKAQVFVINLKAETLQGNPNPEGPMLVFPRPFA